MWWQIYDLLTLFGFLASCCALHIMFRQYVLPYLQLPRLNTKRKESLSIKSNPTQYPTALQDIPILRLAGIPISVEVIGSTEGFFNPNMLYGAIVRLISRNGGIITDTQHAHYEITCTINEVIDSQTGHLICVSFQPSDVNTRCHIDRYFNLSREIFDACTIWDRYMYELAHEICAPILLRYPKYTLKYEALPPFNRFCSSYAQYINQEERIKVEENIRRRIDVQN